jgi:predicted helicase
MHAVTKMRFAKVKQEVKGKMKTVPDKSSIIYNKHFQINNIPEKAYEYVVNGKPAIEWIMERYQVKTDKKSGITNDPNDWSREHENPTYILDLLLSVINLSIQTVEIVEELPGVEF